MTDERWLVAGLGNPEDEYGGTRHNVGADLVRLLARRHDRDLERHKKTRTEAAEIRVGDTRVALVVPMTYMNSSGGPVQQATRWFSVPPERVVVAYDEIDLDPGTFRVKFGGGVNAHNGASDVDRALGTTDSYRLRIGIGRPPGRQPVRDFVLRRFAPADREEVDIALEHAADAVELLVAEGLEPVQNRYHARR
jgi:PTH1 family peptidyl-tRNA hydrolase